MNLDDLRKRIDELDEQLIGLLNERTRAALEIGRLKQEQEQEIYVPSREKTVLDRAKKLNKGPLKNESVLAIYREIMSASLALEHNMKVAYLGPMATFTHQAARSRFGGSVEYVACETIREVFGHVQKKSADYGVVPIENSTEGAVTHTLDEFADTPLKICAEIYLPIAHHLLAKCPREEIVKLYSNPQVFGQCRTWLFRNMPGVELVPVSSTARAAEIAADETACGALASDLAAELYGLDIHERDIQDVVGNSTRFLVLGRSFGAPAGNDKTSLLFGVRHRAGALCSALDILKQHGLNMTKIESRPSKAKAWEYYFFVDVEGHVEDKAVQGALDELGGHCTILTVLGSYPRSADA